jgi:hypothetical protein
MKVGILCINFTGPDGREPGVIVAMKEFKDDEKVIWGRACVPPKFYTIVVEDKSLKDMPDAWKEFGGHRSRVVFDKTLLSAQQQADLDKDEKTPVPIASLAAKYVDKGTDWQPKIDVGVEIG